MTRRAWVAQTWISFIVSVAVTGLGVYCLPVDPWVKGFMAMGILFTVGSTFSLAKTVRDQHESQRLVKRIDDARVSKYISEHDPLREAAWFCSAAGPVLGVPLPFQRGQ